MTEMQQAPMRATGPGQRPDVSRELASLKFEKKNKRQPSLPQNATIQRRPLNHAPVASPFATAKVQKVVYVSRRTPVMSAVKRVKKLLSHVEKRAMQDVDLTKDRNGMRKLAEASEKLEKDGEAVYVKASGRAMEQALRIAEWFRTREDEMLCRVEVKTGSVQAVDDIVEGERDEDEVVFTGRAAEKEQEDSTLTLQSLDFPVEGVSSAPEQTAEAAHAEKENAEPGKVGGTEGVRKPRRRAKRKRREYDQDDVPEARIRWIKTIEIAIFLKG